LRRGGGRANPFPQEGAMMRWFDRTFHYDFPVEMIYVILERLRGTAPRIEEKVRGLSPEVLTRREGERWSIQEHVGHLVDLDELHYARLDDYESGLPALRPADLKNLRTHNANYNARDLGEVLAEFRRERERFIARLERWDAARLAQSAMHPRLQQPMRVVDMAFFVAEHDDHHSARMTELTRLFR
jgi:uncharacterized damage-inducible protein DinB